MRIALVGSAPSSVALAPYDDPSWLIWGCSPGAYPYLKRLDAFFEIHHWRPGENGFVPTYIEWLKGLTCPVYMIEQHPEVPASVAFPKDEILAKYPGLQRSFFTSSLAWMLALAIERIEEDRAARPRMLPNGDITSPPGIGPTITARPSEFTGPNAGRLDEQIKRAQETDEIGLWGVDMAAADEYGHQKPGCHYFMLEAERRGIKVTVPPESDLRQPIPLYGLAESDPIRIKIAVRRKELETRRAQIQHEMAEIDKHYQGKRYEEAFVVGALDDLTYFEQTWTSLHTASALPALPPSS